MSISENGASSDRPYPPTAHTAISSLIPSFESLNSVRTISSTPLESLAAILSPRTTSRIVLRRRSSKACFSTLPVAPWA